MIGNKAFVVLAVITALGVLGTASAALAKGGRHPGGNVRPCSLDGVNPVYHPQSLAMPPSPDHLASSNRGMALGTWNPIVIRNAKPRMPSDGTIGGLIGKLDVLRLECPTCGRQGRYHAARLLEEPGPGYRLTDWLHERTADCPQKNRPVSRERAAL
jgi:hypothetical protein